MISEDAIKQLARKHQTTELNIRREYFQHLFLSYFYQQKGSDAIYFKGGTALRILYQSPRFSEDLDFSTVKAKSNALEDTILNTLAAIEREGIDCRLEEAKTTTGGYLSILQFQAGESSPISIQLEISMRDKNTTGEAATIVSDFLPAYTLVHLAKTQLVQQKLKALLNRQKPRDFYDLYFLFRAHLLTPKERAIVNQVAKLLNTTGLPFERELKQFLPQSHWPLIRDFPKTLKSEIQRFL